MINTLQLSKFYKNSSYEGTPLAEKASNEYTRGKQFFYDALHFFRIA